MNAEIAKLQSQQHKYSMMEFESNKTMWLSQVETQHFTVWENL